MSYGSVRIRVRQSVGTGNNSTLMFRTSFHIRAIAWETSTDSAWVGTNPNLNPGNPSPFGQPASARNCFASAGPPGNNAFGLLPGISGGTKFSDATPWP